MRIYTRQTQNPSKDQKPFIEPSGKTADSGNAFFGKSIQKKESEGGVIKDDEKKNQMQQENQKLEEDKVQKKEGKDPKDEEQKVQKKEDKKEDEKMVQKKSDTKEAEKEEKIAKKSIQMKETGARRISKKADTDGKEASHHIEEKLNASKGKGFALPRDMRKELEGKMKADFRSVRIHTDNEATSMAKELNALAFTHGNDVYFNEGMYNPGSDEGKKLLVHELTHVIQQNK
jgi:hypothetical protein